MGVTNICSFLLTIRTFRGLPSLSDTPDVQEQRFKIIISHFSNMISVKAIFRFYVWNRLIELFWFIWYTQGVLWSLTTTCVIRIINIILIFRMMTMEMY